MAVRIVTFALLQLRGGSRVSPVPRWGTLMVTHSTLSVVCLILPLYIARTELYNRLPDFRHVRVCLFVDDLALENTHHPHEVFASSSLHQRGVAVADWEAPGGHTVMSRRDYTYSTRAG